MRSRTSTLARLVATVTALTGAATGGLVALGAAPASAACSPVEVVAARGTFEPGRLGVIVGDPVFKALQGRFPKKKLSAHPVDYPADASPTSPRKGVQALVKHVTKQARACPKQKFVLVGYSQGAMVVTGALGGAVGGGTKLPKNTHAKITAILLFGNPNRMAGKSGVAKKFAGRTLDICKKGDPVCGGGTNMAAHLAYRSDADRAARFAAEKIRKR